MDWTQVFVILVAMGGGFLFLLNKMESFKKDVETRLTQIEKDILWIKFQLGHVPEEEPKEN